MENELHEAKKELEKALATRDTFFSILPHDLKSPMQSILVFTELLKIQTDKNMLLFIVRNLVTNAVKFTPSGGNIDITVLNKGLLENELTIVLLFLTS
ncbi:MAG: hypothetical protein K9G70_11600 [Prolixibacteraceae bacterium]|nr:hypothetical protein [Prolixibacteraceae bacterium]